jgi:serine/threonine-protein kinase HipA
MSVRDAQQGKAAKRGLSPAVIRQFCAELEIPEKPAADVLIQTVAAAVPEWPDMVAASL